ncbi:hypothetical protein QWY77_04270 [Thalassotalea ponticola]|uniref:hypothetical protein n=1 Tax=Thalassotalea ponticola TaxID=1523392 RepID=UPI0025B3A24F|nr:hypothetical protein [Thalassotalea ponticola]MDN3651981.1 hypothetical protein [Thalassotalea ponticola]
MTFIDKLKNNKVFVYLAWLVGLIAMGGSAYLIMEGFKLFDVIAGVFTPLMWLIGIVMVSSGLGIIAFASILLFALTQK